MHGTRLLALPGRGGIPENASAGIPGSVVVDSRRLSERGFLARSRTRTLELRRLGHRISRRESLSAKNDGDSAFQDLLFVMGLEAAANMEEAFGIPSYGKRYRETASSIKRTIKEKYWDAERGLFSDTRDRRNYSQHVNVLAILNEAVEGDEARAVMERTLADTTLTQTTIYFRHVSEPSAEKSRAGRPTVRQHAGVGRPDGTGPLSDLGRTARTVALAIATLGARARTSNFSARSSVSTATDRDSRASSSSPRSAS